MPSTLLLLSMMLSMLFGSPGKPAASTILANCQKAYDSVKTFEEDITGKSGPLSCTVHLSFARPGKLRVAGKVSVGTRIELVVSGNKTQVFNAGSWQPADSPEMGIATITGIGCMAPTAVSALFFHTQWGALPPDSMSKYVVSEEKIGGQDTFCLKGGGQMRMTLWIDKKSGFLVKTHASVFKNNLDVSFAPPKVNEPIPANRFVK